MLYLLTCWNDNEDLGFSPFVNYRDAFDFGNEFYSEYGFDIDEICESED